MIEDNQLELFVTEDEYSQTLHGLHLLTMKPVLYIANVDEDGLSGNSQVGVVSQIAEAEGSEVVVICNKLESEIIELDEDERAEFLEEMGMVEPGLDRFIRAGYKLLGLHTYFTAGKRKRERGPSWPVPALSRRRQLSTQTLNVVSSRLKLLPTMTMLNSTVRAVQGMPANGVRRARSTSFRMAMSYTFDLMFNLYWFTSAKEAGTT